MAVKPFWAWKYGLKRGHIKASKWVRRNSGCQYLGYADPWASYHTWLSGIQWLAHANP